MSDENQKIEHDTAIWEHGKCISSLDTSKSDLSDVRKEMIRFALDYPIHDIRTYAGYKGDLLVEITISDYTLLPVLKSYAESLGMKTAIKEKFDIRIHEIYCITPDEEVYGIK
ncbi:MAG: hypothetical protein U9Q62_08255 [Campylobacterota bacterium]|nr:hypothetical protein [Campylobacterota bacterium]